jgi:hypothetical protein
MMVATIYIMKAKKRESKYFYHRLYFIRPADQATTPLNSFQAIVPLTGQEKGVLFFTGTYLPQKTDLLSPLERQYNSVQKHVSSYKVILCPGCFVYAQHML